MVRALKKASGAPPQLLRFQYKMALLTAAWRWDNLDLYLTRGSLTVKSDIEKVHPQ